MTSLPSHMRKYAVAIVAAGVALLVAAPIGFAVGKATVTDNLELEQTRVRGLQDQLDDQADELAAVRDLEEIQAQIDAAQDDLKAKRAEVASTEKQLRVLKRGLQQATIDSDGVYEIGKDIKAGTYKTTTGSDRCYYAILSSTNTSDIDTNNLGSSNATVTLQPGKYFLTKNCGTWKQQ